MSNSVQPHRQQTIRLHRPSDSPGKNTGVGCHFLLQCMKVKSENEVAQSCPTVPNPMDCSLPGSSIHGIFQTRVLEWECPSLTFQSIMLLTKSPSWLLIMMDTWGWFIIFFTSRSQSCHMPGKGVPRETGLVWGRTRTLTEASARALGTPLCPATPPLYPAPAIPSDMLTSLHPPWSSASEAICISLGRVFLTAPDFCLACVCWVVPCHCLEYQNSSLCGTLCLRASVYTVCGYTCVSVCVFSKKTLGLSSATCLQKGWQGCVCSRLSLVVYKDSSLFQLHKDGHPRPSALHSWGNLQGLLLTGMGCETSAVSTTFQDYPQL